MRRLVRIRLPPPVPPLEAVFVLSIGTGEESDDVYNELRDELGTFVEAAVIDTEIDIGADSF